MKSADVQVKASPFFFAQGALSALTAHLQARNHNKTA
jgi:hypothetical protein